MAKRMAEAESVRLGGVISRWMGRYGFATSVLGNKAIDVFMHSEACGTHAKRRMATKEGLMRGDRAVFDARPPIKKRKHNYEATTCSRIISVEENKECARL